MMNNENGRSMVEMLGVLAIIGVLSVAGIAGYTIAMRKYRANEIAQAVSVTAVLARTANGGEGITSAAEYTELAHAASSPAGSTITANVNSSNKFKDITVETGNHDLCLAVRDIIGGNSNNALFVDVNPCNNNGTSLTVSVKQ